MKVESNKSIFKPNIELGPVLSSIAAGVIIYDNFGNIVSMNEFARSVLGYSSDDFHVPFQVRRKNLNLCKLNGTPYSVEDTPLYRALHGEIVRNEEMLITRDSDERIWLSGTLSPICDIGNNASGVVFVFNDITERKLVEEERRQAIEQLEIIHEITNIATSSLNVTEVSVRVLNSLAERFGLMAAAIFTPDKKLGELVPVAAYGYTSEFLSGIPSMKLDSEYQNAVVFRSGTPVVGVPPGAHIFLPLKAYQKTVGTMTLSWSTPRTFIQKDVDFFMSIAHEIAVGLENARLYQAEVEAQRTAREEFALKQSLAETLETVVENTNAQIAYLDHELNFIIVNDAYVAGSGHTREELIGRNHFELFPNEENEAIFKRVRDTGEAIEYRAKPFEYADQPWRGVTYWDWKLVPTKDIEGKVTGLVFSLVDVTETIRSKHLSDALNHIHTLISSTLDYAQIKKVAVVKAGQAIQCEAAAILIYENSHWTVKHTYGCPPEFMGTAFSDEEARVSFLATRKKQPVIINDTYIDPRIDQAVVKRYGIRSLLCVPLSMKEEVIGSLLFSYHTEPIAFTNAQVDFATKLGYSISLAMENARLFDAVKKWAHQLLEHQRNLETIIQARTKEIGDINALLRQSEAQHRQIIEVSPDAYFVFAQNKILYANPAAVRLFGDKYSKEIDILKLKDLVESEKYSDIKQLVQKAGESNLPVQLGEITITKDDDKPLTVDVTVVPVIFEGEKAHQYIVRDVTRRKELEKEMARLDRLNMVGEMAAGIGHEVRNPMTTVRGFLQLLGTKQEFQGSREYLNLMVDELDRANLIITEFLSLAKDKSVNLQKCNLNTILETLTPLIDADALVTDKYISFELGEIPEISLDEKEIRQLILNLVRNGLEAMPPKEELTIKTYCQGNQVVMAITDRGPGISPAVLDKLGTPFFTTKDQGTGLGLAVCYSIAVRHGATIQVDTGSTGTTFRVHFNC